MSSDEKDFKQIQDIYLTKYHPLQINRYLLSGLILPTVALLVPVISMYTGDYAATDYLDFYIQVSILLYIFHVVGIVFFRWGINSLKYQNAQINFLLLIIIKMSMDCYLLFYYFALDQLIPSWIVNVAIFFQIIGFLLLFYFIQRAKKMVARGAFRQNDESKMNKQAIQAVILLFLFSAVFIALFFYFLFDLSFLVVDKDIIFFLIASVVIQYCIVVFFPNLYLLRYCKRKFESFTIKY